LPFATSGGPMAILIVDDDPVQGGRPGQIEA
jgi:hypothetical protein